MIMSDFDREIAEIYKEMELEMIASMKRNLGLHLAEEKKEGIDYPQWQAIKIREMRKYQRQNKNLLKYSRRGMDKNIKKHIRDEMKQGTAAEMKRYKEAKGVSAVVMKDSFFKINTDKVDALIKSVHSDFAKADTAVLRMMSDTYRSTIFKYGMYVTNGVYTEKQAYDAAVKDFLSRGINCIEYKDGRRVNIADYTSMAIRTANQRAYMAGEGETRKWLGETLVIISHHATSCPLCKPFENKVLIDDVYSGGKQEDGDYMLMSQAMAAGLFHPRCRHGLGTYYPELEDITHYDTEEKRVNEYGDVKLNRAHIENMVQKYKRLVIGSVDPENIARYQAKLDEWQGKLSQGIANSENSTALLEKHEEISISSGNRINKTIPQSTDGNESTGSDLFTEEMKKRLYQHERILSGNNYETAIAYDPEGNVVFKKKGNRNSVEFSKNELLKLKGKVVTHNHPQDSCFSTEDIVLMYQNQFAELRTCNNFGTYIIRPTKNTINISKNTLDKKMNAIYNEVGSKYNDIAAQNGRSILGYLIDIDNEVMDRIAKEYNLYYRWEPIK